MPIARTITRSVGFTVAAASVVIATACSSSSTSTTDTTAAAAGSSVPATSASPGSSTPKGSAAVTDPSDPVTAAVGEEFDIAVEANPTTGYTWSITTEPDPAVAKLVGTTPPSPGPAVGSGGIETFTFEAVGVGTTTLRLTYARSFDPEDGPTVTEYTIEVSD